MAKKCISCDYPYVPSGGICPNCGKDNRFDFKGSDNFLKLIGIIFCFLLGGFLLFSAYKNFTFDEDDLINREFILQNKFGVNFKSYEYQIYKLDSAGFPDSNCHCGNNLFGYGKWEIKDSKLILYSNDCNCPETRNAKGVYLRKDLKDKPLF
jgi:hypothetical protein